MQYSTYRRPCSTSNLSLNGLSFLPAASLVWSQGSQMPLKQKTGFKPHEKTKCQKVLIKQVSLLSSVHLCAHCSAERRTVSGSLLPTGPFCQTYQLHLHLALLLYKHLQQQITAGFYKRLLTKTEMEQVWREKKRFLKKGKTKVQETHFSLYRYPT